MKQNVKARSLGSIAQVAPRLLCCTSVVALVTVMLILRSGISNVSYAAAAAGNTITVCPAGPPACDFMTIQAAVDAAGPGDTVVAAAGVYTGTVDLKSHLVLRSAAGHGVTSISAANGPILTAHGVVSTRVEGFDITGNNVAAVGMDLLDTDLDLTNCSIRDIRGADGTTATPMARTPSPSKSPEPFVWQSLILRSRTLSAAMGCGHRSIRWQSKRSSRGWRGCRQSQWTISAR